MTSLVLGRVGSIVYPAGASVGPRDVWQHQFVWILRGSATWSVGPDDQEIRPGHLVLVQPGCTDEWRWSRSEPTTHGYAYFTTRGRLRSGSASWPTLRTLGEGDPIPSALRTLLRLDLSDPRDAELAVQTVGFILAVHTHHRTLGAAPMMPGLLETVIQYVNDAWTPTGVARPLTLDELAGSAAVSPAHLCRVFRTRFALGPVAAFERLRLARAATLLTQSDLTIAAVARTCGFADTSHFSHRFRAVYGQPPGRYRESPTAADPSAPLAAAGLLQVAARLAL